MVGVTVVGGRWSVVSGWSVGGGFVLRPVCWDLKVRQLIVIIIKIIKQYRLLSYT